MSVKVRNLTKIYGHQKAITALDFEIHKGEIVGFLGPNGAGKSTTIKIIAGYVPPTKGQVIINDVPISENPVTVKQDIGYLPENNPLYVDMYIQEYLLFIAGIHKIPVSERKQRLLDIIKKCGLQKEARKKIGALSKGYRQRVGLAAALIHNPKVLVLDEPTTGLDPNQILEIRRLIKEVSADKTVLFSSHIMQEVQALCDRVIILNNGVIVANDQLQHIQKHHKNDALVVSYERRWSMPVLEAVEGVTAVFEIADKECPTYQLLFDIERDVRPAVFDLAAKEENRILSMQIEKKSLESLFKELTTGSNNNV